MSNLEKADKIIAKRYAETNPHIREILAEILSGKRVCDIGRDRKCDSQIIRNIKQRFKKYLEEYKNDKETEK